MSADGTSVATKAYFNLPWRYFARDSAKVGGGILNSPRRAWATLTRRALLRSLNRARGVSFRGLSTGKYRHRDGAGDIRMGLLARRGAVCPVVEQRPFGLAMGDLGDAELVPRLL